VDKTASKFAKFHVKRHNWSENIPKSFSGGYFFWNILQTCGQGLIYFVGRQLVWKCCLN